MEPDDAPGEFATDWPEGSRSLAIGESSSGKAKESPATAKRRTMMERRSCTMGLAFIAFSNETMSLPLGRELYRRWRDIVRVGSSKFSTPDPLRTQISCIQCLTSIL